jgi:hypothetical protein
MKTEYLEPWKKIYPTKNDLAKAWSDWFESKSEEWDLYTLTVVFNSRGRQAKPDRWEGEYKKYVLNKIKRALEPNRKNQEYAIPYEEFCYYEFEESSIHRITSSRKPHHIHGLIPIRKKQIHRFWSTDNNNLQERIRKDICSIHTVQSILIEKIEPGKTIDWIRYTIKGKSL